MLRGESRQTEHRRGTEILIKFNISHLILERKKIADGQKTGKKGKPSKKSGITEHKARNTGTAP